MHKTLLAAATALATLALTPAFAADQAMIDAAKKEGEVNWYTTQIVNQFVRPSIAAFEKKYGIKVNYFRGNATDIALKVSSEAKAGRIMADVVDGTATSVMLRRDDQVMKWIPENKFDKQFVDPEGYWIASNFYVLTPGYNTEMVKKADVPKSFADLLDPKWKGKMIWNATSSASAGAGFVGTVLLSMGEEKGMDYLRALAKQNVVSVASSGRQVLDQVIAGEYPLGLQIFNNHAVISARQGAPSGWAPLDTSMAVIATISVTKASAHPNAAKLFMEFVTSEEGQKLLAEAGELPVHPNVKPLDPTLRPEEGKFKALFISPEQLEQSMPRWAKTYQEFFR
ncbi:MAG: putative binding protein component of iron transporter precursor [Hyphomicrobiales bacterium]|nr:putative binding protein component of iron transporter precursor [Hyphomicrobiales bacterium]